MKARREGRKFTKSIEDKQARREERLALKQKRHLALFPSNYDASVFEEEERK